MPQARCLRHRSRTFRESESDENVGLSDLNTKARATARGGPPTMRSKLYRTRSFCLAKSYFAHTSTRAQVECHPILQGACYSAAHVAGPRRLSHSSADDRFPPNQAPTKIRARKRAERTSFIVGPSGGVVWRRAGGVPREKRWGHRNFGDDAGLTRPGAIGVSLTFAGVP